MPANRLPMMANQPGTPNSLIRLEHQPLAGCLLPQSSHWQQLSSLAYLPARGDEKVGGCGLIAPSLMTSSHSADKNQHNLQTTRCIKMMDTDSMCSMVSCKCEICCPESMVVWHSLRRTSFQRTEHLFEFSFVKNNGSSNKIHFNHKSVPYVRLLAHRFLGFESTWLMIFFLTLYDLSRF